MPWTPPEADDRSPFSFPAFRRVWAANLVSNVGTTSLIVGASWMMTSFGATADKVALVQSAATLPIVLLSLLAGALADGLDRRTVMIAAQIVRGTLSAMLAVLAFAGVLTPWLLLLFTFLVGCGVAMNGPAWQASVGDLVPRPVLPSAVSANSVGMNLARSVGPALGGGIVTLAGGATTFLANALCSIPLVLVLATWRPARPIRAQPAAPLGHAMIEGIRHVAASARLRVLLVRSLLVALPASAFQALMPLVARDLLAGGPMTFGVLLGGFGAGAIGGALATRRLRRIATPDALVGGATALMALGLAATAVSRSMVFTLPMLVLGGLGWVLAFSTINVSVQLASPRWIAGRSLALYHTVAFGGLAAGSWLVGLCAAAVGTADALLIAAGLALAALALSTLLPPGAPSSEDLGAPDPPIPTNP